METNYSKILEKIQSIDPVAYGRNRNFLSGDVSMLSPYIARGVISTKMVMDSLFERGYSVNQSFKFLQQLAWRDYFQRVGQNYPELSNTNIKNDPVHMVNAGISRAILEGNTGVNAIDSGIRQLLDKGWIHNHMRMYISMLHGNILNSDWKDGARWMYYYLLDADWASNDLSWQWVVGANSNKLYLANQENINKYSGASQHNTFLDCEYDELRSRKLTHELLSFRQFDFPSETELKEKLKMKYPNILDTADSSLVLSGSIAIYTPYNLDPKWRIDVDLTRVLYISSEELKLRPMSERTLEFILELAGNIDLDYIVWGNLEEVNFSNNVKVIVKEHPLFKFHNATVDERDWMFPEIRGYYSSFFKYWKLAEKQLRKLGYAKD